MVKVHVATLGEIYVIVYPKALGPYNEEMNFSLLINCSPLNVAIAIRRLDCFSGVIGAIGDDLLGCFIVNALRKENVLTYWLKIKKLRTTVAFAVKDKYGEKLLFYRKPYVKTADTELTIKDLPIHEILGSINVLYVSGFSTYKAPLRDTVFYTMKNALKENVETVFSLNLTNYIKIPFKKLLELYSKFFKYSTVVFMKLREVEYLFKSKNYKFITYKLLEKFSNLKYVIVEHGKGVFVRTRKTTVDRLFGEVRYVDLRGSNDAWISSFITYHFIKGVNFEDSIKIANTAFKITCSKPGVLESFPSSRELESVILKVAK